MVVGGAQFQFFEPFLGQLTHTDVIIVQPCVQPSVSFSFRFPFLLTLICQRPCFSSHFGAFTLIDIKISFLLSAPYGRIKAQEISLFSTNKVFCGALFRVW